MSEGGIPDLKLTLKDVKNRRWPPHFFYQTFIYTESRCPVVEVVSSQSKGHEYEPRCG